MFTKFHGYHLVEKYLSDKWEYLNKQSTIYRRLLIATILLIITLVIWNLPTTAFGIAGLTVVQQRIIAIFLLATLMWITEVVPAWATSVFVMVMLLLFTSNSGFKFMVDGPNVGTLLDYEAIMASFADPVIMLFIGGFVLAIAASKTGLDTHLASVLLKPFGAKSESVLLGFILITGFFSMFVSNTATAAMMLTFLAPVFKQLPENEKGRIAMALSIPLAANLGGMGTPIGTPPNTIAMKFLNDPDGLNLGIGFGQWMAFMFPLVILLLVIGWFLLKTLFPFSQKTIKLEIESKLEKTKNTKIVIWTFIVTILLWLTDSLTGVNSNTVALIPLAVFAMTGVIHKRDLEDINWSVIWMVAGGFALGYSLNGSGLAENAVKSIPFENFAPILILVLSGLICYLLSNFISNSATAALLMPILAIVCGAMGDKLNVLGGTPTVLIGIAIAASSAMLLPISTPPNALAYSTNLVKQNDMVRVGLIIGIISMLLGYGLLYLVGKTHLIF